MHNEAVVVLETNAHFPRFLDAELGAESNISVYAERGGEGPAEFAARVTRSLEQTGRPRQVRTCVLCVGVDEGRERTTSRGALLLALWELGRVVLLTERKTAALEQLGQLYDVEIVVKAAPEIVVEQPLMPVRRVA